ncbi:transcription factor SOX-30 isoform X4 [Aethina tumida]|uniref:transcription factor SOX-30 isoform X4 n=1 Tax=Aethina tumida TaxID=116153 RepID=UPI00096B2F46|nr:transcription factor SOX-30 isoform X4 [Aethina tumida]
MNFCQKQDADESAPPEPPDQGKIPRPLNAFMLYANENRKTVAQMYPAESNKEISKKLGLSWRTLSVQEKNKYYQRAKIIDSEHKKKYPNYVYNPKEARIRKGIREATRDRSIGASPMLPRPSARRAASLSNWVPTHDESLIMPNPILQQQSEMWHSYQESIRPRSSGNPYMMPDVPAQYQHPRSEVATPMMLNKHHRHSVGGIAMPRTSPHTNENVPPDESRRQDKPDAGSGFESKPTEESGAVQPLMENGNMQQTGMACEQFMGGSYGQNMSHEQASFDNVEDIKVQKAHTNKSNSMYLPLSCTNFCASPDLFSNDNNYHKEFITKYFQDLPEYEVINVVGEEGVMFSYASFSNSDYDWFDPECDNSRDVLDLSMYPDKNL